MPEENKNKKTIKTGYKPGNVQKTLETTGLAYDNYELQKQQKRMPHNPQQYLDKMIEVGAIEEEHEDGTYDRNFYNPNLDRDKNKQRKMDSLLVDEIHGTSFEVSEGKEIINDIQKPLATTPSGMNDDLTRAHNATFDLPTLDRIDLTATTNAALAQDNSQEKLKIIMKYMSSNQTPEDQLEFINKYDALQVQSVGTQSQESGDGDVTILDLEENKKESSGAQTLANIMEMKKDANPLLNTLGARHQIGSLKTVEGIISDFEKKNPGLLKELANKATTNAALAQDNSQEKLKIIMKYMSSNQTPEDQLEFINKYDALQVQSVGTQSQESGDGDVTILDLEENKKESSGAQTLANIMEMKKDANPLLNTLGARHQIGSLKTVEGIISDFEKKNPGLLKELANKATTNAALAQDNINKNNGINNRPEKLYQKGNVQQCLVPQDPDPKLEKTKADNNHPAKNPKFPME